MIHIQSQMGMKEYIQNKPTSLSSIKTISIFILGCLLFSTTLWGQKKEELEKKKQQILQEIEVAEKLLKSGKKEERNALNQIEQQIAKIRLRENLIETNVKKITIYQGEIGRNVSKMNLLNKELIELKKDYANIVLKSYKSRSDKSRLMFILSSDNFLQAYKRMEYMKQYAAFRKQRGEEIQRITNVLVKINNEIVDQKKQREVLVESNKTEIITFQKETEEKKTLVVSLKKEQKKIAIEIRKKHKESQQIENRIEELIRESILAANRKKESESRNSSTIALTPEAKTLSEGFRYNKGRLPWPVEKGLLTKRFGMQPHPVEKSIMIESNGVEVTTEKNTMARSVFNGHVVDIQLMPNNTAIVMIRHGEFTSVYSNLVNIKVRKGDRVDMKQDIGEVYYNSLLEKAVLKFLIYKNSFKQDPQEWIYNM